MIQYGWLSVWRCHLGITQSFLRVPAEVKADEVEDWAIQHLSDLSWYSSALDTFGKEELSDTGAMTLHKYFQAVQFCLTGKSWGGEPPLSYLTVGGFEIESLDVEVPPRFLSPAEVKAFSQALRTHGEEGCRAKFDSPAMEAAGITAEADHELDTLLGLYRGLVSFFGSAAERNEGVIASVSM
jgi:hypothetical protein